MSDPTSAHGLTRRSVLAMAGIGAVLAGLTYRHVRGGTAPVGEALSVAEAHARAVAGQIVLIDIRRPDEWALTGVGEGAHPIDMRRADFAEALGAVAGPGLSQPIAVICARGVRSARVQGQLLKAGYTRIMDVPEGMLGSASGPGWLARGLPVVTWKENQG